MEHILNFCSIALHQGRFTWRHNSVLNHLTSTILLHKPQDLEVYADIPGSDLNGSTIPPDILPRTSRPDLVLIRRKEKQIFVLELTCSFERNIDSANARKKEKYTQLKSDIEDQGYTCYLVPFEIGSRGYISKRNKLDLTTVFHATNLKFNTAKCMKDLSKIALLSSFSIFHAYTQPTWQDPPLLKP